MLSHHHFIIFIAIIPEGEKSNQHHMTSQLHVSVQNRLPHCTLIARILSHTHNSTAQHVCLKTYWEFKLKKSFLFSGLPGGARPKHREEFDMHLISLSNSHPLSATFITCILYTQPHILHTHTPVQNMSQTGRPFGFSDLWRIAGVSKEAFPAELRVFSSAGLLSINLAGLQRASGSKSTAQLVMAQQLWQGRNVTEPCCQTTANGWLRTWTRAKRGFLQHTRHHSRGGERRGAEVWICHCGSLWIQARAEHFSTVCVRVRVREREWRETNE